MVFASGEGEREKGEREMIMTKCVKYYIDGLSLAAISLPSVLTK